MREEHDIAVLVTPRLRGGRLLPCSTRNDHPGAVDTGEPQRYDRR